MTTKAKHTPSVDLSQWGFHVIASKLGITIEQAKELQAWHAAAPAMWELVEMLLDDPAVGHNYAAVECACKLCDKARAIKRKVEGV